MPIQHIIFEIRTGRDAQHTPETAAQMFATLPKLHNNLWHKLIEQNEQLSFEILFANQTIFFSCYAPMRLAEYLKASVVASYPEAIITQLNYDPLDTLLNLIKTKNQHYFAETGRLELKNQQYYPLKTYQEFKDIDPLATVLSTLSKGQPQDHVLIQYILSPGSDSWKRQAYHNLENLKNKSPDVGIADVINQNSSSAKRLIEKKLNLQGLKAAIKLLVISDSPNRAKLILETLATAYNAISQSESNGLKLKKVYFFKNNFLKTIKQRSFFCNKSQHLSIEELATLFHLPNAQLSVIPNIAWGKKLLGEPPENLPIITRNSPIEIKKNTNVFAQTVYKNSDAKYGLKRIDRRRHMYIIGKTGTGKSTLLANMAINDLKNNEGICVVDPHGDLVETLLNYIPSHRINDVIYFNPADTHRTVQINLFEGGNIEHRELIASGIVSIFKKLYGYSWGPRLEYILRNALLTLLKADTAKLSDVLSLLTNHKFRQKMIDKLDDPILKSFWVDEYNRMQDRQRTEAISSILNKVGQFVSSPLVRNVVNTTKSSFSIEDAMNEGKIILVNLSQGKLGEDNATLLGAMLITKIQLAAMSRAQIKESNRRDFYLYVDEFQNFATESFIKILSEARKYRLNLIIANQYIAQIPEEVQRAIFGNCGTIANFVMGANDAALFTKEYGEKYTSEDLVSLDRYQIINKITIDNIVSRPFPAYTLALAKSSNQQRDKVIRVSRERYAGKK